MATNTSTRASAVDASTSTPTHPQQQPMYTTPYASNMMGQSGMNAGLWSNGRLPWDASRVGRAVPPSATFAGDATHTTQAETGEPNYFLLNEHERTIEALQKENFGLKLRIFYLEEDERTTDRRSSKIGTPSSSKRHSHAPHSHSHRHKEKEREQRDKMEKMEKEIKSRGDALDEQRDLLLKSRTAIERLQKENKGLVLELEELRAWRNSVSSELQRGPEMLSRIEKLESQRADLQMQLELKSADVGHLTAELESKERSLTSAQSEVSSLNAKRREIERERGISDEVMRSLRSHIEGLTMAKDVAEKTLRERDSQIKRMEESHKSQSDAGVRSAEHDIHELKSALEAKELELDQVSERYNEEAERMRSQLSAATARAEKAEVSARESSKHSTETIGDALKRAAKAERRAAESELALESAQARCRENTTVILRLSRELEDARAAGSRALESADSAAGEKEARILADQRADRLGEHNRLLILEIEDRREEMAKMKETLNETEAQLRKLQAEASGAEANAPLQRHVQNLAAQIDFTQKIMDETQEAVLAHTHTSPQRQYQHNSIHNTLTRGTGSRHSHTSRSRDDRERERERRGHRHPHSHRRHLH